MSNESPMLSGSSLEVAYGEHPVLADLSVQFETGTITALIGPNGSGKSTLLRTLARLLRPRHGYVYVDGQGIAELSSRDAARRLAMLPQGPISPEGMRVYELVEQGRYPHAGALRMLRHNDHTAINRALHLTGMTSLRNRTLGQLSGGQQQRAWIAAALAQDTPLLLLDEPTTFLDLRYQLDILDLISTLSRDQDLTVVMALHDLNHAARYADRIVALRGGRVAADGPPTDVLTPDTVSTVFRVHASILRDPQTGSLVCLPYSPDADPSEGD